MKDVNAAIDWYKLNQPAFESLATKVADVIKENIEEHKVLYHSVTSRGKTLESFAAKAKKEKYTDPTNQIKDMAGVRVITYLESDVRKIAEIIESLFDIDWSNSLDQSQLLGSSKLGYRSLHYVAKFGEGRCRLPEYKKYEGLPFEIQIRSLLQHAWAEIEHDRNYKFTGKLPTQLERRFYLVGGMLEMADREFVAIADEIDKYKATVMYELERGDLNIEVNTASLIEYLCNKLSRLAKNIPEGRRYAGDDTLARTIVEELRLFGISTLEQLDKIIPQDLEDTMLAFEPDTTFAGIARTILMVRDVKKYFRVSWRNSWQSIDEDGVKVLNKYGVDSDYLRKHVEIA